MMAHRKGGVLEYHHTPPFSLRGMNASWMAYMHRFVCAIKSWLSIPLWNANFNEKSFLLTHPLFWYVGNAAQVTISSRIRLERSILRLSIFTFARAHSSLIFWAAACCSSCLVLYPPATICGVTWSKHIWTTLTYTAYIYINLSLSLPLDKNLKVDGPTQKPKYP